jgi:hypothetical protein
LKAARLFGVRYLIILAAAFSLDSLRARFLWKYLAPESTEKISADGSSAQFDRELAGKRSRRSEKNLDRYERKTSPSSLLPTRCQAIFPQICCQMLPKNFTEKPLFQRVGRLYL